MSTKARLIVAGGLLGVLLVWFATVTRKDDGPVASSLQRAETDRGKQPAPTATSARPSGNRITASAAALPPTPVPILQSRADDGDGQSACQLGIKLIECADGDCEEEAPPSDSGLLAARYLHQAALAGEPEAMYHYANGDAFIADFSLLNTPEFDQWRKEAPDMLQLAFEAGYLPALPAMLDAYSGRATPLAGLIADDPVKARAIGILLTKLGPRLKVPTQPQRTDVEKAAIALAKEWQHRYFAGMQIPAEGTISLGLFAFAAIDLRPFSGGRCSD